ncbi:hypothetical protein B0H13DRAFT_2542487 [Mycena leptocephala]|nr:hypothetical protein B0H13DRAFT_2542487 [Mycena leptocephala]
MAGACLGTLHLFYWLLQSCIAGHAPLLPTSSISLASRNGREAGHILCSFRPRMGMGILALAVYPHERVQGSVVSTRTRHLLSACCPHNPTIALSARLLHLLRSSPYRIASTFSSFSLVLRRLLCETSSRTCSGGTMAVLSIPIPSTVHSPTHASTSWFSDITPSSPSVISNLRSTLD